MVLTVDATNGTYANGVIFHNPGFAAMPRTLGNT